MRKPFLCQARTEILVELDLVALESGVAIFPCPWKDKLPFFVSMHPHYDRTRSATWASFRCKAAVGSIKFREIGKSLIIQNVLEQLRNELGWISCLEVLWQSKHADILAF